MGQENSSVVDDHVPPETLSERSLEAVADYIKSDKARRIVVMTGAGLSTAAGIPDFRSPETGLYANLARLNLPYAEAVFDISYFRENPEPFYVLAKELYPGKFHPTISHVFIALLASKGLLFQLFTQNIDCLERAAGVPEKLIVEAHGSFATQRCIQCQKPYPDNKMKEHVTNGDVPRCETETCKGLVKPDIVFFGESLPSAFNDKSHYPSEADLALVMGTSLTVHPFAGLPEVVRPETPRVLFNLERVGKMGSRADDVLVLMDCDAGVRKLADLLGWRAELEVKWRAVVGEREAERQLAGASKREQGMGEELNRLAEEVEDVLRLDDNQPDTGSSTPDQEAVQQGPPSRSEQEPAPEEEEHKNGARKDEACQSTESGVKTEVVDMLPVPGESKSVDPAEERKDIPEVGKKEEDNIPMTSKSTSNVQGSVHEHEKKTNSAEVSV